MLAAGISLNLHWEKVFSYDVNDFHHPSLEPPSLMVQNGDHFANVSLPVMTHFHVIPVFQFSLCFPHISLVTVLILNNAYYSLDSSFIPWMVPVDEQKK